MIDSGGMSEQSMGAAMSQSTGGIALDSGGLGQLFEIAKKVARESSLEGLIAQILAESRPWIRAEACSLFLPDYEANQLVIHSSQGDGLAAGGGIRVPMGSGIVGAAMETREAIRVDDVRKDDRFFSKADSDTGFATRSLMAIPLLDGESCLGVIEFLNPIGRDCFTAQDVVLAEYFASLIGGALYRIQVSEAEVKRALLQRDLEMAKELQQGLLPRKFPAPADFAGLDLWGLCDPALDIGGDLFDFFRGPDGKLFFLIGDVSGKGVAAGMFMAEARTLVRAIAKNVVHPCKILEAVNAELHADNTAFLFLTMILGCYDPATGEVVYSQAGHNRAIFCKASGGAEYEPYGGSALGPFPRHNPHPLKTILQPGDCFILYTDGITEAMDSAQRCYGEGRLLRFASDHSSRSAREFAQLLHQDVAAFVNGAEQSDDITILVLKRQAS